MVKPSTLLSLILLFGSLQLLAEGPFPPAAGQPGSTAIRFDDPSIMAWADSVIDYQPGPGVTEGTWDDTSQALGPASPNTLDVVSLGEGGTITLAFSRPIADGPGFDFAVFENAISNQEFSFLELAFVEVSSDNVHFVRFPSHYLGAEPISALQTLGDPTLIDGLASKYTVGWGTPFDLADLRGTKGSEHLDFNAIRYVRLVDIIGDGREVDSMGRKIFDPYTEDFLFGTNGFDLDGIAVLNQSQPHLREWKTGSDGTITLTWWVPAPGAWSFQTSHDLIHWTEPLTEVPGETASFTLEAPSQPTFYRLVEP